MAVDYPEKNSDVKSLLENEFRRYYVILWQMFLCFSSEL